MEKIKASIQKQGPKSVIRKELPESLPTSVQKGYFMLTKAKRTVLNIGLQKYRPGQSEPISVGDAIELDGIIYPLKDAHLPTLDPANPYTLNHEETACLERDAHFLSGQPKAGGPKCAG
jgi:hypothetical protein